MSFLPRFMDAVGNAFLYPCLEKCQCSSVKSCLTGKVWCQTECVCQVLVSVLLIYSPVICSIDEFSLETGNWENHRILLYKLANGLSVVHLSAIFS